LIYEHKVKVKELTHKREQYMQGTKNAPSLTHTQQQLLESRALALHKQVKRQAKVGYNLTKLRRERRGTVQMLKDSNDFNQRILDPQEWQQKLKEKQKAEMKGL
jgi:hypothetical protein